MCLGKTFIINGTLLESALSWLDAAPDVALRFAKQKCHLINLCFFMNGSARCLMNHRLTKGSRLTMAALGKVFALRGIWSCTPLFPNVVTNLKG